MILNIGRVCAKTRGRDAGKYCVVVSKPQKSMIVVDNGKSRNRVSIFQIEPLPESFDIEEKTSSEDIKKLLENRTIKV